MTVSSGQRGIPMHSINAAKNLAFRPFNRSATSGERQALAHSIGGLVPLSIGRMASSGERGFLARTADDKVAGVKNSPLCEISDCTICDLCTELKIVISGVTTCSDGCYDHGASSIYWSNLPDINGTYTVPFYDELSSSCDFKVIDNDSAYTHNYSFYYGVTGCSGSPTVSAEEEIAIRLYIYNDGRIDMRVTSECYASARFFTDPSYSDTVENNCAAIMGAGLVINNEPTTSGDCSSVRLGYGGTATITAS